MTPPYSRTWVAAHPQDLARSNLFPNLFGSRSTIATTGNEGHNGPLHATIIGWDDESDSYISTFDEPSYYDTMIFKEQIPTSTSTVVADTLLLHNMDKVARLAVAFSPPTHPIKLEDINQIHIINVTNRHIEISVVVCDESQCVTLLVPISFRHDCSTNCSHNSSADQCILDSIFELDVEAQELIKLRDVEYNSDLRP
eukprot:CAMPEP_0203635162 /NCGR_PEP_ID=MMETSP0088-20131115/2001_1 /ASSEMBLY_ACC=CAM_ASM_001087 /TAXON_ID=426623 /ORGANISM="Chaetoceros affinis, Strain CCMP159" /LENGTH=197 /DNA_ID=CAMNT_0050488959 /DNA_START=81 /DNA_END=674 /DNA_ORIENTATION=+